MAPRDLAELSSDLRRLERADLVDYAALQPGKIAFGDVRDVASEGAASVRSVVRLAHRFGFKSYRGTQSVYRLPLRSY